MRARRAEPPDAPDLMAMGRAFWTSEILFAANELGVFDALEDRPMSPAQLARRLRLSTRGADILLHALCALGLLRRRAGTFSLSAVSRKHLVADRPEYLGHILRHHANLRLRWQHLAEVVRTGRPGSGPARTSGTDTLRDFILGMADIAGPMARELFSKLDLKGVQRILDVGGGPGTYLLTALALCPSAQGLLFDLPEVIAIARERVESAGMAGRVRTVAGDYLADRFGSDFDLVIMSNVLHSNSAAHCRLLVRKALAALNPGGRLVVNEFKLSPDGTSPAGSAIFAVNMLVAASEGRVYTDRQIAGWMRRAGFTGVRSFPLMDRATATVGERPR